MKRILKRILLLVCAVALTLSATACAEGCSLVGRRAAYGKPAYTATPVPTPAQEETPAQDGTETETPSGTPELTPAPTPFHSELHYADIVYQSPDVEGLKAAISALQADVERGGGDLTDLFDRYDSVCDRYENASSANAHAFLLYAMDVTNEALNDEYQRVDGALTDVYTLLTDVGIALFDSSAEAERMAIERYGADYVRVTRQDDVLYSSAIADLLAEDLKLQSDYDAISVSFAVSYKGRDWTIDDIISDSSLSYDEYYKLFEQYCREFNESAGKVFLEMLALRSEIAAEAGYGNYAAYRYDCYERDFTVTDAKAFHAAVKEYIVPLYAEASAAADTYLLYGATYDEDAFFDTLRSAAADFDPRMSEALSYMLDHGLYDTAVSDKKMEMSFTTFLSEYGMPFIFMQWDDGYQSVSTMLHEFGHFMSNYFDSGNYSLDMAEIDSQGLELLLTPYYEKFYGAKYAEAAQTKLLISALDSIIAGSMEDEFQQTVYENPGMTLDEINSIYSRLTSEYGMDVMGYTAEYWALIPHTFQSPMYYISYAVSVIPALELWNMARTDRKAAVDTYFSIMERPIYAEFRTVMAENSLPDPVLPSTVKQIAEMLGTYFS